MLPIGQRQGVKLKSRKKKLVTSVILVLFLLGFCFSSYSLSQRQSEKINQVLEDKMGIDKNFYEVKLTKSRGKDYILATIIINEETIKGFADQDIRQKLSNFTDRNALYLSVLASSREATFNPYDLIVRQAGDAWAVLSATDLTNGFKNGKLAVNLGDGKWASRGIVVFPDQLDLSNSFSLQFGNSILELNDTATPKISSEKETTKEKEITKDKEVIKKDKITTQEKCETCEEASPKKEKETVPQKKQVKVSKPPKAEEGMTLGLNFIALALLTLTFL